MIAGPFVRSAVRFGIACAITALVLYAEGERLMRLAGAEVAGDWEAWPIARGAPSIAIALALPLLVVIVAYGALLPMLETRRGRTGWGAAMGLIALAFAIELSTGRKARVPVARVPFVVAVVLVVAASTVWLAPRVVTAVKRRAWLAPLLGIATLVVAFELDRRVLPRLYPAFHLGLSLLMLVAIVMVAYGVSTLRRTGIALAVVGALMAATAALRAPRAARDLAKYDNARRIVAERSGVIAPVLELAARKWPPRPFDDGGSVAADPLAQTHARTLEATGRALLVVTIDALRADHVGAYGYGRATTPNLDALAREGVRFERAYTPTPHTSYAVTSLMTGKYMRPVLALEAAAGVPRRDDETWAGLFRTYGFRTAAFFPEAVWTVDAERFAKLRERKLDFEYTWIEFAAPDLRAKQLADWLAAAPKEKPLFAWVHLFEPHEPYVAHAKHPFGSTELDAYDSEIAAADDGLGRMVRAFRAARPGAIVVVSADHGEAFGEHRARYHGTTVYEEQIRVPLVVSAPGLVAEGRVVSRPVQLVDLFPTMLSAYGIPRPPRVRGVDLGELLARAEPRAGAGVAFSEVEDQAMFARDDVRLVCNRKIVTCALYDLKSDPGQLAPLGNDPRIAVLRKEMGALLGASARLEGFAAGDAQHWPEALRRGFTGDVDAAPEVAFLLDDVDVAFRRRAAEVLTRLASPVVEEQVKRALGTEKDAVARKWLAAARLRTAREKPPTHLEIELASRSLDDRSSLARFSALGIGEAMSRSAPSPGPAAQARAYDVLVDALAANPEMELRSDGELARSALRVLPVLLKGSTGTLAKRATVMLIDALSDVRLRREAAAALGALGDPTAALELEKKLAVERHADARIPEVLALAELAPPTRALSHLVRFLGVPEPPPGAADALLVLQKKLVSAPFFTAVKTPQGIVQGSMTAPPGATHRLVVVGPKTGMLTATIGGVTYSGRATDAGGFVELGDAVSKGGLVAVEVSTTQGAITALALVARVDDLPPPKAAHSLSDPSEPSKKDGDGQE